MASTTLKVTLKSGKVVVLREPKIKHTELAAQAAAQHSNGKPQLMGMFMQRELLKTLLISVDGKVLSASDAEDLDSLFSLADYGQLMLAVDEISSGGEALGKAQIEIVPSGDR
jgi:hypothetical protein